MRKYGCWLWVLHTTTRETKLDLATRISWELNSDILWHFGLFVSPFCRSWIISSGLNCCGFICRLGAFSTLHEVHWYSHIIAIETNWLPNFFVHQKHRPKSAVVVSSSPLKTEEAIRRSAGRFEPRCARWSSPSVATLQLNRLLQPCK